MNESLKYKILKAGKTFLSDELFHKTANYYLHLRKGVWPKTLNTKRPVTFNEKIIHNKLFNRFEEGHLLADKYEVRKFISGVIGDEYLIPKIGVYDNVDLIPISQLPSQFVVKITQGSGWNIIVKDKSRIDTEKIKKQLNFWLNLDYSFYGREWQYNKKTSKIIIEDYLKGPLHDYKFFCFNGYPKYIQVDIDRNKVHKRNFYDLDWNLQEFRLMYSNSEIEIPKPKELEEMIDLAKKIALQLKDKMNFVRVDFYNYEGKIFFGEITFHPDGGCAPFFPKKFDLILGEQLSVSP